MIRSQKTWMSVLALALLLVFAATASASEIQGTLTSVDPDDHLLVVTDKEATEWNFQMFVTGDVRINGEERTIWDLQPGDLVTVTFDIDEQRMMATAIRANREQ